MGVGHPTTPVDPGASRDRIVLNGITAIGRHGVFGHEKRNGQPFVDVVLHTDIRAAEASDDVADAPHYGVLAERVKEEITAGPSNLIEKLAVSKAAVMVSMSTDISLNVESGEVLCLIGPFGIRQEHLPALHQPSGSHRRRHDRRGRRNDRIPKRGKPVA